MLQQIKKMLTYFVNYLWLNLITINTLPHISPPVSSGAAHYIFFFRLLTHFDYIIIGTHCEVYCSLYIVRVCYLCHAPVSS